MPKFGYKAKKGPEELVEDVIEAETLDQAVQKISNLGLTPIDVFPISDKGGRKKGQFLPSLTFSKRIPSNALVIFTRQTSDLVEAAVPILKTLEVVLKQTENPKLQEVIQQMYSVVKDGGSFSDALSQHPKTFSKLYISMIKSGEISGQLSLILNRLADLLEKEQETRGKIQLSLAYPSLIIIVGVMTVFVLLAFIVPRLSVIFDDFNQDLPGPTLLVMSVANFFSQFWWLILAVVSLTGAYVWKWVKSENGKMQFALMQLKMPILGKFIRDAEVGRFARTLGTLLESGVVIISALQSVWAVISNEVLRTEIKKVSEQVANGVSIAKALKSCEYFPETAVNMIAVGEETGRLEKGLYKLADSCEREADRTSKTILSLLGPMILIGVVLIIGGVVIAMLLPLLQMNLIVQ